MLQVAAGSTPLLKPYRSSDGAARALCHGDTGGELHQGRDVPVEGMRQLHHDVQRGLGELRVAAVGLPRFGVDEPVLRGLENQGDRVALVLVAEEPAFGAVDLYFLVAGLRERVEVTLNQDLVLE